jgi:CheY-like chemotaxis protein
MIKFKRTLLIDDDPITNFLHEKVVTKMNITEDIRIAINGKEALEIIEGLCQCGEGCPDLIFLDINMPVMDGFEFLDHFHKLEINNRKNILVVIVSSSANPNDIELAQKLNIKIIQKPLMQENIEFLFAD